MVSFDVSMQPRFFGATSNFLPLGVALRKFMLNRFSYHHPLIHYSTRLGTSKSGVALRILSVALRVGEKTASYQPSVIVDENRKSS